MAAAGGLIGAEAIEGAVGSLIGEKGMSKVHDFVKQHNAGDLLKKIQTVKGRRDLIQKGMDAEKKYSDKALDTASFLKKHDLISEKHEKKAKKIIGKVGGSIHDVLNKASQFNEFTNHLFK